MGQNGQNKGGFSLDTIIKVVWLVCVVVVLAVIGRIACSDGTPQEKIDALVGGIE